MMTASPMYLSSVPPSSWRMSVQAVRYSFISSTRSGRRELLRHGRERLDVAEVGRDVLDDPAELRLLAGIHHPVDERGRDVGPEHPLDPALLLLLLDDLPDEADEARGERRAQGGHDGDDEAAVLKSWNATAT
jgi:hypothetical protein